MCIASQGFQKVRTSSLSAGGGGNWVLSDLKSLLETGKSFAGS